MKGHTCDWADLLWSAHVLSLLAQPAWHHAQLLSLVCGARMSAPQSKNCVRASCFLKHLRQWRVGPWRQGFFNLPTPKQPRGSRGFGAPQTNLGAPRPYMMRPCTPPSFHRASTRLLVLHTRPSWEEVRESCPPWGKTPARRC